MPRRASFLLTLFCLGTLLHAWPERAQAGGRGKRPAKRGAVVVPAWVKTMTSKNTPVRGAAKPDLVLVEFSDYECVFCHRAHAKLQRVLKKYGKRIRIYFRHYPLDSSCNTTLRTQRHPHACLAARAALCAQAQGRFWTFHHGLNLLKGKLSRAAILGLAKTHKLRRSTFLGCLNSAKTKRRLQADIAAATKLRITGTPTFYAGGPRIKRFELSNPSVAYFDKLFKLLDKQRKKRRGRR